MCKTPPLFEAHPSHACVCVFSPPSRQQQQQQRQRQRRMKEGNELCGLPFRSNSRKETIGSQHNLIIFIGTNLNKKFISFEQTLLF